MSPSVDFLSANLALNPINSARGGDSFLIMDNNTIVSNGNPSLMNENSSNLSNKQISFYLVRKGDTLSEIAAAFNISQETIIWANNLPTNYRVKIDDELIILPISGVRHQIKNNENLELIAEIYQADLGEIIYYNNLINDNDLLVGQELIIPNGILALNKNETKNINSDLIRPVVGGLRTQGLHGRNAVDLAVTLNSPVYSAASGKVVEIGFSWWGYGNYIRIKHDNGLQTFYAHLNSIDVSEEQSVLAGEIIGKVGSTGNSTGAHLHFEVWNGPNPF